jgi:hypothetical protein
MRLPVIALVKDRHPRIIVLVPMMSEAEAVAVLQSFKADETIHSE